MTKRDLLLLLEPFTDDIEIVGPDLSPLYAVYDYSSPTGAVIILTDVPIKRNPRNYRIAVLGSHEQ